MDSSYCIKTIVLDIASSDLAKVEAQIKKQKEVVDLVRVNPKDKNSFKQTYIVYLDPDDFTAVMKFVKQHKDISNIQVP